MFLSGGGRDLPRGAVKKNPPANPGHKGWSLIWEDSAFHEAV